MKDDVGKKPRKATTKKLASEFIIGKLFVY